MSVVRAAVTDFNSLDGLGIRVDGGSLLVQSGEVSEIAGYCGATGIRATDAVVRVEDSRIVEMNGEYGYGIVVQGLRAPSTW